MATAPEQLKRRIHGQEPDTEAIQSFFEASADAAREYLAATNAALKAWTQAVRAGQTAATKIAVAGTKLVEDTLQPR